ncbi:hypothetical protein [Aeoliella mucimassa]|nr:hypothetical protein [Aeoliella mucimassa]
MSHDNLQYIEQLVASGIFRTRDEAMNEAIDLLRHRIESQDTDSEAYESWSARFEEWLAGHGDIEAVAEDDREGIYAGRGE